MNNHVLLKNCRIFKNDYVTEPCDILISNGLIKDIGHFPDADGIDVKGNYVCAGFIDIHTHGGNGSDFMDATDEAFDSVLKYHLKNGTTSVVATSLTASKKNIVRFLNRVRSYKTKPQKYADLLGAHLEGPFLSLKGSGAQNPGYLLDPQKDDYDFILQNSDIIKSVTIAPERDVNGSMTKALSEKGILVCGGHDDGAYPEFIPSINSGLSHLTHIYCAMSGFGTKTGVREIGLREYGLWNDNITVEMIADNVHITPEMAKFIVKCKGSDNVALVSDTLRCAGMPCDDCLYVLGDSSDSNSLKVKVSNGIAVLEDGSKFAGSITDIHQMVKNLVAAGFGIAEAVKMGTAVPARIVGEEKIGKVEIGCYANLCVMDKNLDIKEVYKYGEIIKV